MSYIHIQGARTNNLKNINIDIPHYKLVVVTGVSGSGKSSLVFDTIYSESQRKYIENMPTSFRQFVHMLKQPDVDLIEGLSPAIAIKQKTNYKNTRNTVGTVTEINDYIRLLFAKIGVPFCPEHNQPLIVKTISQITDWTMSLPINSDILILSPVTKNDYASLETICKNLLSQGFLRLYIDNQLMEIEEAITNKKLACTSKIYVVIDRLKIKENNKDRLSSSFEIATKLGIGHVLIKNLSDGKDKIFSTVHSCPICNYFINILEPSLFNFNSSKGYCKKCKGIGIEYYFDKSIVENNNLSEILEIFCLKTGINIDEFHEIYGLNNEKLFDSININKKDLVLSRIKESCGLKRNINISSEEIITFLENLFRESKSSYLKSLLNKCLKIRPCLECNGAKLCLEARHVILYNNNESNKKDSGLSITEIESMSIDDCLLFFKKLEKQENLISHPILKRILPRLSFLIKMGLGYLSLGRSINTISGGEAQRIKLSSQICSGLIGITYILDEPSQGLHKHDTKILIEALKNLRDLGNSIIIIEHDKEIISSADWIIDMGPEGGKNGGFVTAQGTPKQIIDNHNSLTGFYLNNNDYKKVSNKCVNNKTKWLIIEKAKFNNLKYIDVHIPIGYLTCITGVSGSGKSTLVNDIIQYGVTNNLSGYKEFSDRYEALRGAEFFDYIIKIDQNSINSNGTTNSNIATYCGIFTTIRELFSKTIESKIRGYTLNRFSFNMKGGRCELCKGAGISKVEMHFMPDVYVVCEECKGSKYNRETLEIYYGGLNISDVLNLTIGEAKTFFKNIPRITNKIDMLIKLGLSYLSLGHNINSLSGGESQRVQISIELSKQTQGRTLYILDEPTIGLHDHDIKFLLNIIRNLIACNNTVIVVEHNIDIIKTADWVIDIGPGGGVNGGSVVAQGTIETISSSKDSYTGVYLS
ncbi:excinuclease ABC subunit A uvrA [Candidatus Kinetoplastibacterium oncopeltii TCC290E]|uniref:UvrABC system protein A n=1 Tax=Candidatus Kinetoplastidibacterium stringomonadis TCC290E TaxID=1208920 RepID=M1M9P3_9PROT|nr:excinuclease ABC subunit UvrA [Candidatus Kinetoplastibacterium oncopeltii]AGF48670.1 excinuclease ABC subunit A uvrA [Candidatus Kinetoplastibacterium oncopeltii TCC290E]